ncbi:thioredoxin domain-containing protein [Pilimelia columellifera]|uniref:Thioredoxin domain-containing protein n=1 Tax=Pilimelia columellifera subsp. columellifera TaxID=706583 RepID=A0ABP6AW49_9ACTN
MNRLGDATSPYLQQHAANPVDWWPWGPEPLAEASRRDVPVLISVGYSACHWCHVMAHESFEDDTVGAALRDGFVSIKVDREEHPDVDAVYMTATQAMTGHGGWPMTVFATGDGEPFFCATYLSREQLLEVVGAIRSAWAEQRGAVLAQGRAVVEAVAGAQAIGRGGAPMTPATLDAAAATLVRQHDDAHGGFGGAPKFPPHLNLLFLLRRHQRAGDERALETVRHTAEAMARGGLYDQLGGGFARYSVDETWTVPHFEKMLYDNALLLRGYTQLWRLTGDRLAGRVAAETAQFLLRDLRTAEGGFASALDADADGVEGLTYAWTPTQLVEVLGPEDGAWAADLFAVTAGGTFEHGTSVLRLARDIDAADPAIRDRWRVARAALLAARAARPQPARDDKVVAAWNGYAVTALAEFARLAALTQLPSIPDLSPAPTSAGPSTGPADDVDGAAAAAVAASDAAVAAGELLAAVHLVDGRLRRVSRDGVAGAPAGVLEDYGAVAEAFCALHQLTGDGVWLRRAGELLDVALARFGREGAGFYDTADDAHPLITRPADPTDNATPSGQSAVCAALVAYAALTGQTRYRSAAEAALATIAPAAARHPRATGYACAVGEALLSGPYEIAVVTDDPAGDPLVAAALWAAPAGAVVVAGSPDADGAPLLAGRTRINGAATAHVCRDFACEQPTTDVSVLLKSLTGR